MVFFVATPVPDSGEHAMLTRCGVQTQTCEVDFGARDVDISPAPGFDSNPMQLEAMLGHQSPPTALFVGLASPELAPARPAQLDRSSGFVGELFDASPCIRGAAQAVNCCNLAHEELDVVGFDVMELEFLASSNPPSRLGRRRHSCEPCSDPGGPGG